MVERSVMSSESESPPFSRGQCRTRLPYSLSLPQGVCRSRGCPGVSWARGPYVRNGGRPQSLPDGWGVDPAPLPPGPTGGLGPAGSVPGFGEGRAIKMSF